MKKILMISETMGGGVGVFVTQLCNDMCGAFEVYLACAAKRPQTPKNYKLLFDSRVHLIELKHLENNIWNIVNDLKAIKELKEIEEQVHPDIIHLHSSIAGGIGRLAFWNKSGSVVYSPHGYAHILLGGGIKSLFYETAERILGNRALTLTGCESEDEEAKRLGKRTAYIETGANIKELSLALDGIKPMKNDRFTVFTLGRICTQKRPRLFNRIAELVPEARFLWIGGGELRDQLTAPNIEITGWKQSRFENLAIAKSADVYVLCSFGEAVAMSLIESMYMEKLCLVSNVIGNKSVIRDGVNGYLCDTAEDYAVKIRNAMKCFPAELARHAYQDVLETYNTNVMNEKFVRFYNSILCESAGGGEALIK